MMEPLAPSAEPGLPAVRAGAFVAQWVTPCDPDQIQPNGVDLRGERLFRVTGPGRLNPEGTVAGPRVEVPWPQEEALPPGAYVVRYRERVTIPPGHVGQIFPRSSLLRNGAVLYSALWDQGYAGQGEGLLVLWQSMYIPPGARLGQLVLWRAEAAPGYKGQYQGEGSPAP